MYTPCSDDVNQKGDSGVMEFALLCFLQKAGSPRGEPVGEQRFH
jgi:hypothetical protein